MIIFNEEAHTYTLDGKPVPNVTSILKPLTNYGNIPAGILERARQKGVAIHKMVELDCHDELDVDTLPEWMERAYKEWCKFKQTYQFECLESERLRYHPEYNYCGTQDLYGLMVIKQGKKEVQVEADIDIKRSLAAGGIIGYQLAAYQEARTYEVINKASRFALVLREDKPFKLQEYKDENDIISFLTCLEFYRLKERHV